MKKLNKKGFTLIELLAVIVVLAIIMVIATTSITSAMNNARVNSFIDSYKMIKKEIKNRNALDGSGITDTNEKIKCDDDAKKTAADGSQVDDPDNYCSKIYDISAADYKMKVTGDSSSGYSVTFEAKDTGKFKNIDLTKTGICPSGATCSTRTKMTETGIK